MSAPWTLPLMLLLALCQHAHAQRVTGVSPSQGSRNGGVRITVHGIGFADNFDLNNDPNVGTHTKLVAGSEYPCDLHQDGVTNITATCYTRAMPEGDYQVKVTVNGVLVTDHCNSRPSDCVFSVKDSVTPKVNTLTPRSGVPGTLLTADAKMFTSRYGSNEESQNSRTEKITKFWANGKICDVKDTTTDQYYGLNLYNDSNGVAHDDGYFKCKPNNNYIGNYNISFIVEGQYGRSLPDPTLLHVHTNGIGMYQMYTEIAGLSANSGSTEGGLMLTVSGQHFDNTNSPARVVIGDTPCTVREPISSTAIVCRTPADPSSSPAVNTGNRGLTLTVLNGTTDYDTANWASGGTSRVDEAYYQTVNYTDHVTKLEGAFVAPETGTFRFYLKSRSNSKLTLSDPATTTELVSVTSSSWNGRGAESSSVSLVKDQVYQLTVKSGSSSDSGVEVTARHYETRYLASQTGAAMAETQELVFNSVVQQEVQRLEVTAPGSTVAGSGEVQVITVSGDLTDSFIIAFDGAYTEPMVADSTDFDAVATALNGLPSLAGQTVSVTEDQTGSSRSYTVTFPAALGNVAEMTGQPSRSPGRLTVSVSTSTQGQATLESFRLEFGGAISRPLSTTASTGQVKSALEEMAGVRCHSKLSSGRTLMDCETTDTCAGTRTGDEEPFCGRFSAKNPGRLYAKAENDQGYYLDSSSGTLCLGHKGPVTSVWLRFQYQDGPDTLSDIISFTITVPTAQMTRWRYTCQDVYSLVRTKQPGKTGYMIDSFGISRDRSSQYDAFVDQVVLNRANTVSDLITAPKMRMAQARPNNAFIRGVDVKGSVGDYTVEIDPYLCGNTFGLITVPLASVSGGTGSGSNQATFSVSSGGQRISVRNTRQHKASQPIAGSFTVSFNNRASQAITVIPDLEVSVVRDTLSLIQGLGDVDVTHTGDCKAFTYTVTMATKAGDQPKLTIDDSRLTGNTVTTTVRDKEHGSLWYRPIPGDMLQTLHSSPQVKVYINDVPTSCASGVDCSFTWSSASTPTVSGINPATGGLGTVVTVTGTGFDNSGNVVTVGGAACSVGTTSPTSLQCTMAVGPNGPQSVNVTVPSKGLASGSATFTFTSSVSSILPTSGSLEGGFPLTISGQGFASDATVTVGGATCDVTNATVLALVCTVPATATGSAGTASVVVTQGSTVLTSPTNFTYSTGQTPVVTAISVSSVNAWGGDLIGIDGSGFGTSVPYVTVNGAALTVKSNTDVRVEAELPPLAPGSFPLRLRVDGKGLADTRTNNIPNIDVTLKVTGLSPTRGSLYGGTVLTVTGQGFGTNSSRLEVTLGGHRCVVDTLTSGQLTCKLDYTGTTHTVTNQGSHKDYGRGYAYDHKQLSIMEGDCVRWSWTTPSFVAGIAYGIYQTATDTDKVTMTGGFASSVHAANGQYEFCFNTPGTYFYWSGYVNAPYNTIYLRGQVTVTQRQSSLVDLSVKVGGVEAEYDTVSGSSPSSSGACSGDESLVSGCVAVNNVSPNNASIFQYVLHECATPSVTAISHSNGTTMDTITFTGTGFGLSNCQNEIQYGGVAAGVVSFSSDTRVQFSVSAQGPPPVALLEQFTLRVGNRGNALMAITNDTDRRFALLPVISDITPYKGSLGGGTLITITGSGFAPNVTDVEVKIDGYKYCTVQTATTTQVTCLTPSSSSAKQASLEVKTYHGGNALPVECRASFCSFLYDPAVTAAITSVTPSSLSAAATSLTIRGTGFGSTASDVSVTVGGTACSVSGTVTNSQVVCSTGHVPAGTHIPQVTVSGKGLATADNSHAVDSQALVSSILPAQGSIHGGTRVTITGHGFKATSTVTVDGSACIVATETGSSIECVTPAHAAGAVSVAVTSNTVSFPATNFTYSSAATPTVTSVNPASGQAGGSVVITGTGFSLTRAHNTVNIGGVAATVTGATATSLTVTLGNQNTGTFPIVVDVSGSGLSNNDVPFEYTLGNVNINPTTGTTAGGQTLTVTGSGFLPGSTDVTVCGVACPPVNGSTTATQLLCITPANAVTVSTPCSVAVTVNSVTKTAGSQYTYDPAVTPEITGVTPQRGGTAGGTLLTITGTGFGTSKPAVAVTVGGATCDVQTVIDTQITCTTNSAASGNYQVDVNVNGMGSALQTNASFQFIDVWTSPFTWGGNSPPVAGDLVVVPPGQILLLDNSTERLAMVLIQGTLIFDEKNLELHADNILITNGGALQVGTEANPFPEQYTATIKLYGHQRSKELPIYGTKVLALREGTLDLHGHPTPVTWTQLAATANAGDTQLSLTTPVNWKANDEIVIPTTSHRHSQIQNEVNVIRSVSIDGLTLTLRDPLSYKHVVVQHTMQDGSVITLRGEVGLLSHNVKVMGSVNDEWTENIPACPSGFNTGEFSTQTCFQGRFGAETGSDQFGAHIIAHAPQPDTKAAVIRLSYIEITHAGQAFRLGRYPVHLHLNGDMSGSYVRGLGIHHSFNRAVNVHGTHNALVEHVVLYNIMGGAFFLEDGIETNNTFQYNLGVFVKPSSSLRNDDVTPATFWVTNPDNIIIHNHAAGGSHFGFWYRMHAHPEGPSFDPNICPRNVPLNRFENNTAHSFGWFGLWIFEDMFPHVGGACSGPSQVSVFKTLTAWNCEKGSESVNTGALQFKDFLLVNNEKAGHELKQLVSVPQYDEVNGPLIDGGKIIAHLGNKLDQEGNRQCTKAAIVLPYQNGFMVINVQFYNFDRAGCAAFEFTRIAGTCTKFCGGFTYKTKGLQWENTNNRVHYEWESEGVFKDMDGTLTGTAGYSVIPTTPTLPPSSCTANVPEMSVTGVPGSVCDDTVKFHRFAFNNPVPSSLLFKDVLFKNQHGTSRSPYADKRMTHKPGWMFVMVGGECYEMEFDNAGHISNVSYDGAYYQFDIGDTLCITQKAEKPDRVFMDGSTHINMSDPLPSPAAAQHGDWYYDDVNGKISYYIKRTSKRKKRGAILYNNDLKVDFRAFRCYYDNCIPPPDPVKVTATPGNAIPWSSLSSWDFRNGSKPVQGDNVTIPADKWLVIDEDIPPLDFLIIEGGLSAAPDASLSFTLDVNYIIVSGRLAIGWEHEPFNGSARIVLRGEHSTPKYPVTSGPELGAKFIGVYGGLDLHGVKPSVKWSRLATTANSGDTTLTLEDSVTWATGDEVMLTTTDSSAWHTETFRLTNVVGNVLTLNSSVQHKHIAHSETLGSGQNLKLTARVALLTRNIVIEGGSYTNMDRQSFGARVLVGKAVFNGISRNGFARVENTEFYRSGQEGYTEAYDPRYSLAFVDVLSDNTTDFYSYARDNTFHNGFSPAIGVFAVDNLEVSGNVIHHTVYYAIHTNSIGTRVEGNLMALNIFSGTYQDRRETTNIHFDAAVEAFEATNLVLKNNIVAGSERMGYHLAGQPCNTPASALWTNNEAHSCLTGAAIEPADTPADSTCYLWSGFVLWKNADWGLYVNNGPSIQVKNLVAAENGASLMTYVVGPSATSHAMEDKTIDVSDSTFVGRTTSYDCSLDRMDTSDDSVALSSQARGWRHGSCGMTGIVFPNFVSGSNSMPKKPWAGTMAYQAIKGIMRISNVVFEHFKSDGAGSTDFAISTNKKNDDMQHPVQVSGVSLYDVDNTSKVFYHNPNVGKINPSDCVDMDCDALKKAMVKDTDGSLLGAPGYVIPNSGYQWDGDPRHGLGDYRIPKVMLTAQDGSRIPTATKCPYKGIYNYGNCTWMSTWNAYHCDNSVDYAMLTIESMDADTETRRLSPVAVFSGGYVDLLNGPQDHGWCSGYTCRKRLSTFPAIVPLDRWVELYMSSTVPQHMRFMMLNVQPTDCVGLSIWKNQPHRLDVYVDGSYVMPLNGYMAGGRFFAKTEDFRDQYMPALANKTMGDNYMRFYENTLYWVQCGSGIMEIRTADVLIVSFGLPAMNNEEFYGEQIVNHLAQFLSIPIEKVRVVDVVRETGGAGRRKRQTGTTYFYIEVGDTATDNSSTVDLVTAADKIVTQVQLYGMDNIINATVLYTSILEPSAGPAASFSSLQKVGTLVMTSHPVGGKEGQPFITQPQLQVQDSNGAAVDYLGALDTPWRVEVSISSGGGGQANMIGNTTVTFVNGTADFSGLGIDRMGSYILDFNITHPAEAANYSLQSLAVTVLGRNVRTEAEIVSTSRIINTPLSLTLRLVDVDTGDNITAIDWRGHTWTATATISDPDAYHGSLGGTTSVTFDPATGRADFLDLQLTRSGVCPVLVTVTSSPNDYTLTAELQLDVMTVTQRDLVKEETSTIEVSFDIPYNATAAPYHSAQVRNYFSEQPGIVIESHSYRQGSLVVSMVVSGSNSGVNSTLYVICDNISNGTTFTFSGQTVSMSSYMTYNGQTFYGVSCGAVPEEDDGLHPGIIAAIVIISVAVLLLAGVVLLWYFKIYPKTKTTDTNTAHYLGQRNDPIEDILFREDTFMSLKSRSVSTPMPPVTTTLGILKDELPPMPGTPEPKVRSARPLTPNSVSPQPVNQETQHLPLSGPSPMVKRPVWR